MLNLSGDKILDLMLYGIIVYGLIVIVILHIKRK